MNIFRQLYNNQQGSVIITVGFAMMALIGATGVAVDMGRTNLLHSRMSKSLDAAGLAAGTTISTTNVATEARKYFDANFQNYMGATVTNFDVVASDNGTIINLSASAILPMSLMKVFGQDKALVHAETEITRATSGLELVMVLDNTGSMGGSKLTSLKSAANDLVDIVFGDGDIPDDLWVGMVPFSQSVNIGSARTSWVDNTYMNSLDWGPSPNSWGGCVDARGSGMDVTDNPPSSGLFTTYYWPDEYYNNWKYINYYGNLVYRTPFSQYRGPNKYCSQELTPLTANKSNIETAISNMQAVGYTHINFGAVWGWRMLSPRWQNLWGGEMDSNNLPLDYNTPQMNKAAIIMTDGDNTMSSRIRSAYGYLSEGILGSTSSYWAARELDDRLAEVCTSMKDNNIIVYTVVFGNISTESQNLMKTCATQDSFYFHSPTSSDLQKSFRTIGDSLANLRVSK